MARVITSTAGVTLLMRIIGTSPSSKCVCIYQPKAIYFQQRNAWFHTTNFIGDSLMLFVIHVTTNTSENWLLS